jgi:hypothetical protein
MANTINANVVWADSTDNQIKKTLWTKWLNYTDTQAPYRTLWFLFSLVLQGVCFLPVPAALMFYYNAPMVVLGITMTLFFANVIAGMGGSGIRVMLTLFAASVLIHLAMLAIFIL